MDEYFQAIDRTPLLSAAEEQAVARRIRQGDREARDHMIRANLRLVVRIARSYAGRGLDLPDLIAEGNVGLLRAVDDFDPAVGTRFSTYASFWIKQSIQRALKYTSRTVRIPSYMVDLLARWRQGAARVRGQLGRPPTREEVAHYLGLTAKQVAGLERAIRVSEVAAGAEQADGPRLLEEAVPDARSGRVEASLVKAEQVHLLRRLLDSLDPREATVLRMRFGLNQDQPSTLDQIGRHLGLTRERVRQLQVSALRKLQAQFQDAEEGPPPGRPRPAFSPAC